MPSKYNDQYINCICGVKVKKSSVSSHCDTKKHMRGFLLHCNNPSYLYMVDFFDNEEKQLKEIC